MSATAATATGASGEDATLPPIRLRFVLLLGLVGLAMLQLYPRLQAAFRLHEVTVATADYGLCMVGPTGPTLLRDRPRELQRLVRRRLVASEAADRPFRRCAKLARSITGSVSVERAHGLTAGEFREHGGKGAATLDELAVPTASLAQLSASAWPFVRGGYTQLMKPSLGALEAAHVPAPARPALGRGLPARAAIYRNVWREGTGYGLALGAGSDTALYVTSDRGLSFRPLARRGDVFERHAERCASLDGRRVYRLTPREDGSAQQVLFSLEAGEPVLSELSPIAERVLGSGCDEHGLVTLTADRERLHLRSCPFAGRCGELALPPLLVGASPHAVDIAKVKGTIVLSVAQEGVVRVVSSRDEGKSFTPPVVAFDVAEYPELGAVRRAPLRLLALGERLLLYAGTAMGNSNDVYVVLASDDQGVSFRTP
ncbi:MAG TPA: hypothetical protein VJN18_12835 [Polyangiaceae bacterium]|nr:hypothetical protein [Polyangiaceae bacterium]